MARLIMPEPGLRSRQIASWLPLGWVADQAAPSRAHHSGVSSTLMIPVIPALLKRLLRQVPAQMTDS